MTRVWYFLKNDTGRNGAKFRAENENLPSSADTPHKPQIWLFHDAVLQPTAKKWTKVKNARAGRAKLWLLPTKYANL